MKKMLNFGERMVPGIIIILFSAYYFKSIFSDNGAGLVEGEATVHINAVFYGVVVLLLTLSLVKEILLKTRIQFENVDKIYDRNIGIEFVKILLLIILHIMYWRLVNKESLMFIGMMGSIQGLLMPRFVSRNVYDGDESFIFDGVQYYYSEIESFKDEFGLKVELRFADITKDMGCNNGKTKDVIMNILRNHIPEKERDTHGRKQISEADLVE